jgi:hypothetical protein
MDFVLNTNIKFTFLAVIPVIFWFFQNVRTSRELVYSFLFFTAFSRGTLELIGISSSLTLLIMEGIVVFLFFEVLFLTNKKSFKLPGIFFVVSFIIISILSYIANEFDFINLLLFLRRYLLVILFFYILINTNFNAGEQNFLNKLLIYIFISQIFANIIKLIIIGDIIEPYIGTIANLGGSLTTLVALIGGAYCVSTYLITFRKRYLIWIFGFIIFALIGGKRAIIGYFPLIYFIGLFYFQKKFKKANTKFFKKVFIALFSAGSIFYVSVRTLPTLNPENTIGGSFDLEYVINYSEEYTSGGHVEDNIGRSEAPIYLMNKLLNQDIYKTLLGFGAGHLVKSSFNKEVAGQDSDDITMSRYGVGYGARTGFLQMLLQVGFLGVIFYILFFINIFRKISKIQTSLLMNKEKILYLTSIIILFIVFLDYFTYSDMVSVLGAVSFSYMWILSILFRKMKLS